VAARQQPAGGPTQPTDPADPPEDPEAVARQILLRRLTDQPRSRAELAKALAGKRVPDDVSVRLLDRFEEVGLVDDAAFARSWVESRQRGRGLARRALAHELRTKGVDSETAREALDAVDPEVEQETARRLVRRKIPSLARHPRAVAQRRLIGMLARKGYPPGVARGVVDDELAAAQSFDDPGPGDVRDESDLP
jgi:regulatory protein